MAAPPTSLIIGISGQDGSYLADHLLNSGRTVWGTTRRANGAPIANFQRLNLDGRISVVQADPADLRQLAFALEASGADEVYLLAGQSSVGYSFDNPKETFDGTASTVLAALEAVRLAGRPVRFFYAASAECFGPVEAPCDVDAPFRPRSPYGVAKAAGFWAVSSYRANYGLHACSAILFNHESPLRPEWFVSRRLVVTAARIAAGSDEKLTLGNLHCRRDWGWAPEYVEAMPAMLARDEPEDFVIATGETRPLSDFCAAVFAALGLDWRDHVVFSPELARPNDLPVMLAATERTAERLGWRARTGLDALARRLVACEQAGLVS